MVSVRKQATVGLGAVEKRKVFRRLKLKPGRPAQLPVALRTELYPDSVLSVNDIPQLLYVCVLFLEENCQQL
jgi:hypothetical protein